MLHKHTLAILAFAAPLVLGSPLTVFKRWEDKCESFVLPVIPENISAVVTKAWYYPTGTLFNESDSYNALVSTNTSAFCRIMLNITTSPVSGSVSEVWLPDEFNGRLMGSGDGGSGGGITWSDMLYTGVNLGWASHGTNGGHASNYSSVIFAINNSESVIDWGYRAMASLPHQGTVAAKAIITSYYGSDDFKSYYAGCSAGGGQGWKEAERYPADYDAIIVGFPAVDDVRQSASALWVNQKVLPVNGSTWFSNHTWGIVHAEALRQCDGLDGLVDGVISNPLKCNFQPAKIACKPWQLGNTTDCLTFEQLETLRYVYEPWVDTNATYVYAGFPPGAELGFIEGNFLPDGGEYGQDGDFFRHIVYNDSAWTVDQISFASVQLGLETVAADNSAGPNITEFVARGGKLIQYVGWNDIYLSPKAGIQWYDTVDTFMSTNTNYTTDDYFRLFLVPGMKHCYDGTGAFVFGQPESYELYPPPSLEPSHNAIFGLLDLYENGNAPTQFIGTSYHNNTASLGVSYQRPICQYPKSPVFKGGDWTRPESFACEI